MEETGQLGAAVIGTMQQQRESLIKSTGKASEVNVLTGTARTIMLAIQRRAITNKALLASAALALLIMIGVVVYIGYFQSPKK